MTVLRNSKKITKYLTILISVIIFIGGFAYYWHIKTIDTPCTGTNCNVLFISVDSLRTDHMSTYGYNRDTTPNFTALANKATLFQNYFSTSYLTPVAEGSVQTGLYPTSNGITNFDSTLPQDKSILAEYLKNLGYNTNAILSSPEFLTYPTLKESFSRGFDSFQYVVPIPQYASPSNREFPSLSSVSQDLSNSKTKHSFLWLALGGVHWPYGLDYPNLYADPGYNGMFAHKQLSWGIFQNIYQNTYYPTKTKLTGADTQYIKDEYDNGIHAFDTFLGQVMDELKRQNLQNKTIIVIQSEHGEDLGEHNYYAHYDILDTQTHTPLLVYVPGLKGNKKISSLASGVDVLPTVLNLIGTSVPNSLQGKSLAPLIKGSETDGQRKVAYLERIPLWEEAVLNIKQSLMLRGINVSSTHDEDIAIRTDQWKYILRLSKDRLQVISWWQYISGQSLVFPDAELYDLKNDPGETKNVINEHPDIANQLQTQLKSWYAGVSANSPSNPQHTNDIQPYF